MKQILLKPQVDTDKWINEFSDMYECLAVSVNKLTQTTTKVTLKMFLQKCQMRKYLTYVSSMEKWMEE